MRLRDQFLTLSAAYAKAVGRSEARVSTIIYGAGNAISRLRDGADMGSERLHNGIQWFSDNWPSETDWPTEVDRPAQNAANSGSGVPSRARAPSGPAAEAADEMPCKDFVGLTTGDATEAA